MLAEKNENIKIAYEILKRVSRDREAKMAYEARQAEIMDQLTREKVAKEQGKKEGILSIAKNLIGLLDDETIAAKTGLSLKEIEELKK